MSTHLAPGDKGAGFWGDLHSCDLPYWTAELILQYASELENVIDISSEKIFECCF